MIVGKGLVVSLVGVLLLSGCIAPRPFEQVEREMNENPVRATFVVPPPCDYIDAPHASSALVGTWSAAGMTDGVDYSLRSVPPKRWRSPWKRSFTFSSDGTYQENDQFNGSHVRAAGRWTYSDGRLELDIVKNGTTVAHRDFRLLWLDDRTFDLRWSSDEAEAVWWKEHVLDGGRFAGWNNSVVISYDRSGCKRKTSRMRKGRTGVIYDVMDPPLRYRCTSGGRTFATPSGAPAGVIVSPTGAAVPNLTPQQDGSPASSSAVEIDSIPL